MSADKMPKLPKSCCASDWGGKYSEPLFTVPAMHAYARAYAAEQVRELVEALEAIADPTTRTDGMFAHFALQRFQAIARYAIAKHKEQP